MIIIIIVACVDLYDDDDDDGDDDEVRKDLESLLVRVAFHSHRLLGSRVCAGLSFLSFLFARKLGSLLVRKLLSLSRL